MDGKLPQNVGHFARVLRAAGIPVGPGAVVDALKALELAGVRSRDDVYWTLHAIFVKRREHMALFEQAFALFFRSRGYLEKMIAAMTPQLTDTASPPAGEPVRRRVADAFKSMAQSQKRDAPPEITFDARFTVSDSEVLRKKDFEEMSASEVEEAKRQIAKLALPNDWIPTRRFHADPRGVRVDPRASFRARLRAGGEFVPPARRAPRAKHPPVVAIVDISGSMEPYTRLFLHFLHVLATSRKVTTFLFGTRLSNVTRLMAARDPDEALSRTSGQVEDWSGGTRIATSLRLFNKDWSRRVLGQGSIVLLFTDGLERDADPGLAVEMDRLHRSCRSLIWLNPLLRYDGFEAKASGIRRMLPHVDEFRPIHSLASMADLADALRSERSYQADPRRYLRRAV